MWCFSVLCFPESLFLCTCNYLHLQSSQDRERWIVGLKNAVRTILESGKSPQVRNSIIGLDHDYDVPDDDDDEIATYTIDRDNDNISGMLDVGGALPTSNRAVGGENRMTPSAEKEENLDADSVHEDEYVRGANGVPRSSSEEESQDIDKAFTMLDALVVDPGFKDGAENGHHTASYTIERGRTGRTDHDDDDAMLAASGIEIDEFPSSRSFNTAEALTSSGDRASKTTSVYASVYEASDFSAPLPDTPMMASTGKVLDNDSVGGSGGDSDSSRGSSIGSRLGSGNSGGGGSTAEDDEHAAETLDTVSKIPSALDQDLDLEYNRVPNQRNSYDTAGRRTSGLSGDDGTPGQQQRGRQERDDNGGDGVIGGADRFASFTSSHALRNNNDSMKISDTTVAVTLWQGKKKYVLDMPLVKGGTVSDLRQTVAKLDATMTPEMQATLELWEVTSGGMEKKLEDDADPHAVVRARGRLVLLYPDKRLIILFFPDGDFMLAHIKWNVTAAEICRGINKDLKHKLETIAEPGLFLRKNFKDILFAPDDVPLDALYYPAAENGLRERIPHGMLPHVPSPAVRCAYRSITKPPMM